MSNEEQINQELDNIAPSKPSNQALIDAYIASSPFLNKSTIDKRIYILKLLESAIEKPFTELIPSDLRTFIITQKEKSHWEKPSTVILYITIIRMFFRFLINDRYISADKNPAKDLKAPRHSIESEIRTLTAEEIRKLLRAVESPCISLREKLLFYLAMTSGLRASEICSIKKEHIDLNKCLIYIPKDDVKGKYRAKLVHISTKAKHYLEMYLIQYPTQKDLLFENHYKRPIVRQLVHSAMKTIIDLAYPYKGSWHKPMGPHMARHTFASRWIESGGDVHALRAIMGWKSFAQLDRYVSVSPAFIQKSAMKVERKLLKV